MKLTRAITIQVIIVIFFLTGMAAAASKKENLGPVAQRVIEVNRGISAAEKGCISCHQEQSPSIVLDWKSSMHGRANVTCGDCHNADKSEKDAFQCSGLTGSSTYITAVPSPRDCSRCHPVEAQQFQESDHWGSYQSIVKLKNMSIEWEGKGSDTPEATGCVQCHGGKVDYVDGRPSGSHYPDEGVGKIHADGSAGNCGACHTRHRFNIVEARMGENCGACHMGPDHPQLEIWKESKHGKRYAAERNEWKWDSAPDAWEPGDYSAPTCVVCHMAGIGTLQTSHNISQRLSWEAEKPLSVRTTNWQTKRKDMETACLNCHGPGWVKGFYSQYDSAIKLYNEKYYKPAKKMMDELYELKLISSDNVWDDDIEIIFYHLWHDEGRRARMGTAMMGQDYAHWHGFFELAKDMEEITKEYKKLKSKEK